MNNLFAGSAFKLLNLTIFTFTSLLFVKFKSGLSPLQQLFMIAIFGAISFVPWIIATGGRHLKTSNFKIYILRTLLSVSGMLTWVKAIMLLGANEATLIAYLTPLLTLFIAALLKQEKLRAECLLGVLSCIVVIVMFLGLKGRPVSTEGVVLALISANIWALFDLVCKWQGQTVHYLTQSFYNFVCSSVLMAPFAYKALFMLTRADVYMLGSVGFLRAINVICLFMAYRLAPLNFLMPLSYTRIIIVAVGSFLMLDIYPTLDLLFCAGLIILINVFVFARRARIVLQPR